MKSLNNEQHGGNHYKGFEIEPAEFIIRNKIEFVPGEVIKQVARYRMKDGATDLKKAIHYIRMQLEHEYGISSTITFEEPNGPTNEDKFKEFVELNLNLPDAVCIVDLIGVRTVIVLPHRDATYGVQGYLADVDDDPGWEIRDARIVPTDMPPNQTIWIKLVELGLIKETKPDGERRVGDGEAARRR